MVDWKPQTCPLSLRRRDKKRGCNNGHGVPEAAARAAAECPAETVPVLIAAPEERSAALEAGDGDAGGRLFVLFHLLGALHPSVSRNDPCPCGSGKKFKRGCLV